MQTHPEQIHNAAAAAEGQVYLERMRRLEGQMAQVAGVAIVA